MRVIITCGCGGTTQFAKDAFKILFPKDKYDKLIEKPENDFLDSINEYLSIYAGKDIDFSQPYALMLTYKRYNETKIFSIVDIYDLMKGYKIC